MTILWNIFSHLISTFVYYRFFNRMLGRKYSPYFVFFAMVVWYFAVSCINMWLYKVFPQLLFFFLNDLAITFVLFGGNKSKKFLTALLLHTGIISIAAFVFIPFTSYVYIGIDDPDKLNLLYGICDVLIFLFSTAVLEFLGRAFKNFAGNLPFHCCVYLFCLTIFITQSVVFICQYQQDNTRDQFWPASLSTFCALAGIGLIIFSVYYVDKRLSLSLAEQQNVLLKGHVTSLKHQAETTAVFRHDIKNHFICLKNLFEAGHAAEAESYLNDIVNSGRQMEMTVTTGNIYVDALLQEKKATGTHDQIQMDIDMALPPSLSISPMDLCIILSNGLDNAIEACAEITEADIPRQITVTSHVKQNHLLITITNTIAHPVTIIDNHIETTKLDKHLHGIGLYNIQSAVSRSRGDLKLSTSNDRFIFSLILPI